MTIKFTSALGRLKFRYLLLVALLAAGLTFGTMFVFGCEETETETAAEAATATETAAAAAAETETAAETAAAIEEEEERVICPEPIYIIRKPSDWDKYPQSLIDNCPQIFHKEAPYDFPKLEE